jgi:hypothetical protein
MYNNISLIRTPLNQTSLNPDKVLAGKKGLYFGAVSSGINQLVLVGCLNSANTAV